MPFRTSTWNWRLRPTRPSWQLYLIGIIKISYYYKGVSAQIITWGDDQKNLCHWGIWTRHRNGQSSIYNFKPTSDEPNLPHHFSFDSCKLQKQFTKTSQKLQIPLLLFIFIIIEVGSYQLIAKVMIVIDLHKN